MPEGALVSGSSLPWQAPPRVPIVTAASSVTCLHFIEGKAGTFTPNLSSPAARGHGFRWQRTQGGQCWLLEAVVHSVAPIPARVQGSDFNSLHSL